MLANPDRRLAACGKSTDDGGPKFMAYQWDIFFSYPRRPPIGPWVQDHLFPMLEKWLSAAMPRPPKLFLDIQMEVGSHWPSNLAESLLRSRYMVAVWAPPYFGSQWCLAEWKSMLARQAKLNLGKGRNSGLIYPIRFFDGETFPKAAKETQDAHDYTSFNTFPPGKAPIRSKAYRAFETKVQALAADLAQRVEAAPPWQRSWPLLKPPAPKARPLSFSQVGLR